MAQLNQKWPYAVYIEII